MDEQFFRRIVREEVAAAVAGSEERLAAKIQASEAQQSEAMQSLEVRQSEAMQSLEARLLEAIETSEGRQLEALQASERRLAENGRMMFRQLADLYRATLERIERTEKHLGDQIGQVGGAVEALRHSLERQDFRADELGRRITALETQRPGHEDL